MEELSSLQKFTVHQVIEFRKKVLQDDNIYNISFEEIGQLFLKEFIGDDIFENFTFEQIRLQYISLLDIGTNKITIHFEGKQKEICLSPIPVQEKEFFTYICKKYISLQKEPRLCLLELYQKTSVDLQEIEERISKYEKQIEEQNRQKNELQPDDYKVQLLKYYVNLNIEAKNEIIKFLTSRNIKMCALEKSSSKFEFISSLSFFQQEPYTYSYRNQPLRYDADKLSHIANKFLDVTIPEMRNLEKLYKDSPSEFYEYAQKYIIDKKIIEHIEKYIKENHFLNARRHVLQPALDNYQKDKVLFLNLTPLQIEGIFYDYCIGLGIPEKSIQKASIGEKLDKIIAINPNLHDFEYFKFVFPKTRNRVAHGKLFKEEECNQISCTLLLDLHDVCGRVTSDNIPVNLLVILLKEIKESRNINSNLIKISYANLQGIKCPNFYNLQEAIDLVEKKCNEDQLFNYLYEIITKSTNNLVLIKCIEKILNFYKNKGIQIHNHNELFKEIQQIREIEISIKNKEVNFIEFCEALDSLL
ncbi:hypothetical protein I8751_29090 [Nostocaceae cyanobacterium CENA357]|uniref:Uncharacterized protein n=1 Tax=Atlanticothrix silvestris CENA357 TaxID=1725252 RepID=A0A8J7L4T0_9CYAN|nr:hypothetical protein [Atlanticothrix silvestris]MBH8556310.1 hypothetical protein [Atlanticothrix silvestris CENA357]